MLVRDLTLRIMRGDRLGLIGANGAGKSTLLKLILGTLPPDAGTVRLGTKLSIAYFDQLREAARRRTHARRDDQPGLGVGGDGRRAQARAVLSRRFPVSAAAGRHARPGAVGRRAQSAAARPALRAAREPPGAGRADERSRHRIARPPRIHAADLPRHAAAREPRPDVSRQRGDADAGGGVARTAGDAGTWYEYAGGYSDWVAQRPGRDGAAARDAAASKGTAGSPAKAPSPAASRRSGAPAAKLTFAERRELAALPDELEALEREQHALDRTHVPPRLPPGERRDDPGRPARAPRRSSTRSPGSSSAGASSTAAPAARGRASAGAAGPGRGGQNATSMSPGDMPGSLPCQPGPGAPFTMGQSRLFRAR